MFQFPFPFPNYAMFIPIPMGLPREKLETVILIAMRTCTTYALYVFLFAANRPADNR